MAVVERGGRYRIVSARTGTVIDLSSSNNTYVSGWDFHGGQNQIWEISEEKGFWHIKNVRSGKYLAPEYSECRNGVKIVGSDTRFNWKIKPDEKNTSLLKITLPDTRFDVDLSGGKAACGTKVHLWLREDNNKNQSWTFDKVI